MAAICDSEQLTTLRKHLGHQTFRAGQEQLVASTATATRAVRVDIVALAGLESRQTLVAGFEAPTSGRPSRTAPRETGRFGRHA